MLDFSVDDTDVWGYLPKTQHFMYFIQLGMYSTGIIQMHKL